MNSKRKILLSLLIVFVLAMSVSIASASEDADNKAISSSIDDNAIISSMDYADSPESEIEMESNTEDSILSSAEEQNAQDILESNAEEEIVSSTQEDILSAGKKDLEIWVRGGTVKEGDNVSLEICFLEKAEYYTEESGIAHPIKNVVIKAGNQTHTLNISSGEYEEDGIYLELGNDFESGNYTVTVTIPENSYYNAKTFTFKNQIRILSETNKGDIEISKEDIFGSNTFKGKYGYVYLYLYGTAEGLNLTGDVKVTLTNSNATKTYIGTVKDSEVKVKLGNDLPTGKYSIKVQYLGNTYYNPTSTITSSNKFIVYDSSNKIPLEGVGTTVRNNYKGQNCKVKFLVFDKTADISLAGKIKVTLKRNKKTIKTYIVKVDKDGNAVLSLGKKLALGKYTINVKYYGSKYYKKYTRTKAFKIYKNVVKFSNATKEVKKSKAKKARFKITMKNRSKKVLAKKVLYIKINKKTYKAKTNKKGVAAFTLKLPKVVKTYKYKITFKGDKTNYKKTYSGKLKVC